MLRQRIALDRTDIFQACVARSTGATRKTNDAADDDVDDIDDDVSNSRRRRRLTTQRSPASIAAERLVRRDVALSFFFLFIHILFISKNQLFDIDALERDVSAAELAAASPEAALSAFSINGRAHEANAVASFDRSVADRLKRCADGVDALKALAAAAGASVNAQHAEHSHLVVLHLYALLERISATWARIRQRRLQRAATVRSPT